MPNDKFKSLALLAIGGNSITKADQEGNIPQQFSNSRKTAQHILDMLAQGYNLVITHGNGPQIGNTLLRVELSSHSVYPLPLDTCVSDTQGGMGYMLQQVIGNTLREEGIKKIPLTIITQVLVDQNDPAFLNPTKPIGPFYSQTKAQDLIRENGWKIIEDSGRGYRRVVPSPRPLEIIEAEAIKALIRNGFLVIAAGGGGIPVVKDNNNLRGIEAVIDKDLASSLLASQIQAELLLISTDVEQVAIFYNTPKEIKLSNITLKEAEKYLNDGHFPAGSMGPKILASIAFLKGGGKTVIITNPQNIGNALAGKTGTKITLN
ncbi:MAG: carbamate kinase [Armatimonadetes bacterium]|nr:carbamate kinase [Armatimonadota bacterium]